MLPWSSIPGKSSQWLQSASPWKEDPPTYHWAGRNAYRFKFRKCLWCPPELRDWRVLNSIRLVGGADPSSWAQAHACAHAPSPGQVRLTPASSNQAAGLLARAVTNPALFGVLGILLVQSCGSPDGVGHHERPQKSSCQHTFPDSRKGKAGSPSQVHLSQQRCCAQAAVFTGTQTPPSDHPEERGEGEAVRKMPGSGGSPGLREGREKTHLTPLSLQSSFRSRSYNTSVSYSDRGDKAKRAAGEVRWAAAPGTQRVLRG